MITVTILLTLLTSATAFAQDMSTFVPMTLQTVTDINFNQEIRAMTAADAGFLRTVNYVKVNRRDSVSNNVYLPVAKDLTKPLMSGNIWMVLFPDRKDIFALDSVKLIGPDNLEVPYAVRCSKDSAGLISYCQIYVSHTLLNRCPTCGNGIYVNNQIVQTTKTYNINKPGQYRIEALYKTYAQLKEVWYKATNEGLNIGALDSNYDGKISRTEIKPLEEAMAYVFSKDSGSTTPSVKKSFEINLN